MTVQGNSAPVPGYTEGFTGVADTGKQMRAYDTLPVTVRRALDAALFQICCVATLDFYRDHGARATIAEIEDSNRSFLEAIGHGGLECTKTFSSSPSTRIARREFATRTWAKRKLRFAASGLTIATADGS